MDSRQLRYFAAIFEHRTLSNAAENLRVAASALSHHLANLEAELGVTLFDRKPRGMEPTAAGHRLHEHAKAILKAMAAAEADVREAGGEWSEVGLISASSRTTLPAAVQAQKRLILGHAGRAYPALAAQQSELEPVLPGRTLNKGRDVGRRRVNDE